MNTIVNIYSDKIGEISRFLSSFYKKNIFLPNDLKWEKIFENPIEIADIIGTENNADKLIRYLYERYPY